MKRLALGAAAVLALAVPAVAAAPARLQVSAQEYTFGLSRTSIKSGHAIIELANFGQDPHDLRLRRIGGTRTYAIGTIQPGETADLETVLRAGKFQLWCSIADHRARGMHAVLTVRP